MYLYAARNASARSNYFSNTMSYNHNLNICGNQVAYTSYYYFTVSLDVNSIAQLENSTTHDQLDNSTAQLNNSLDNSTAHLDNSTARLDNWESRLSECPERNVSNNSEFLSSNVIHQSPGK